MNEQHAAYASKAFQFVLRFGYNINCQIEGGYRLDVTEVTDRDGLNLLIKHHPRPDELFRAEARFYPKASDGELGGRLYLYLLQLDGKRIDLPMGGVTTTFAGWNPNGSPELVDALIV